MSDKKNRPEPPKTEIRDIYEKARRIIVGDEIEFSRKPTISESRPAPSRPQKEPPPSKK